MVLASYPNLEPPNGKVAQYPGPTTAGRPIYAGRFDMKERTAASEDRTDI
jgi:hypothetical protein